MSSSLLSFLASVRTTVLYTAKSSLTKYTLVLGNTSCDLDSFISAIVFSYFHSQNSKAKGNVIDHFYVPILNLPTVPSSELWRLRPEFGTTLGLATKTRPVMESKSGNERTEAVKGLLENLITIADLTATSSSSFYSTFARESDIKSSKTVETKAEQYQDVILVDHNSPQVSELSSEELSSRFNLVGCIDHHVDESIIPRSASPRIIRTGIGSCTSLVVQHLRDEHIWPDSSDSTSDVSELAKLALAPILIDTFNLKATGEKCSDVDRDAVSFLESHLDASWDRDAFFNAVAESKNNSLDLLTMPEVFERDYKEWTESANGTDKELTIGIPSLVRSLSWLVQKAGSSEKLADAISDFSRESEHKLDICALITKSSGQGGKFKKELAVIAFGKPAAEALYKFEQDMKDQLKLEEWKEDEALLNAMQKKVSDGGACKVWWQGDTEKSRKQVAPALREAARNSS